MFALCIALSVVGAEPVREPITESELHAFFDALKESKAKPRNPRLDLTGMRVGHVGEVLHLPAAKKGANPSGRTLLSLIRIIDGKKEAIIGYQSFGISARNGGPVLLDKGFLLVRGVDYSDQVEGQFCDLPGTWKVTDRTLEMIYGELKRIFVLEPIEIKLEP
jgi:hypothetical protein